MNKKPLFIRLDPEFKKELEILRIKKGYSSMQEMIEKLLIKFMKENKK